MGYIPGPRDREKIHLLRCQEVLPMIQLLSMIHGWWIIFSYAFRRRSSVLSINSANYTKYCTQLFSDVRKTNLLLFPSYSRQNSFPVTVE